MTQNEVICDIFGCDWEDLNFSEQNVASRFLEWMVKNCGITGDCPTRDSNIISAVQMACLQVFGVTYESIMCKSRERTKCDKRFMIYKIVREMSKSSDYTLAKYFPKDRVTIFYYGINKANILLSVDQDFRKQYVRLEQAVKEIYNKYYEQSDSGD